MIVNYFKKSCNIGHLITTILFLLFITLIFTNCNKKAPTELNGDNIEKDGIITIRFDETNWDSTESHTYTLDTLNVSEETNVIDIPNAVPFELPTLASVMIYFWGDFTGVQDTIFLWFEYEEDNPYKGKRRVTEITQIGKNQTCVMLLGYGTEPMGPVKGYIFILDTDNNNTGTGYVRFEGQSMDEKILVDAAKNTVCYITNAATVEFRITTMPFHPEGHEANNLDIYSLDYDSYKKLPDRAICVLNIKRDNSTSILAFSTFYGYGKFMLPCSIKAFGFAPNFK